MRFLGIRDFVLSFAVVGVVSFRFAVEVAPAKARRLELPVIVSLLLDVAVDFGIGGNSRTYVVVYHLDFSSVAS